MEFKEKQFKNEEVRVDGNIFIDCAFKNCVLVYAGGPPPTMVGCGFGSCSWSFVEHAANTVKFMRAMYHGMGDGGRELVEQTFENIRKRDKE